MATDITHPVLLIFDSGTGRFRLNPRIYPLSSHKERRRRDLAAFGDGGPLERTVSASPSRFARIATREAAILGIGGVAAVVFLNHEFFYLRPGFAPYDGPLPAYFVLTAVLYLFVRMAFLVAGMFFPRKRPEFILCPECGRELDDASPHRVAEHNRITLTPRPTEKEVLAAIMLRKAIDDARRSSTHELAGPRVEVPGPPGAVENPPVSFDEFERILRDIDFSAGWRRGVPDRRPKGPDRRP